ncbi:MAG: Rne/Rng family ribonuclease [Clostridiales bacterium]|nr:Rne/Rng family ribonuclease [Clostridiales bacterium]
MLIHFDGEDVSIVVCHEGQLREVYLPRRGEERLLGAIYKGRVANVLPGMQAAFVDIGLEKNSFLYVDDVYTPAPLYGGLSPADVRPLSRDIGSLLKEGQEVLVQIFKESQGDKGARVTMQPTLPGRYTVLLPVGSHVAVSRRIEEEAERERLREIMKDLVVGQGAIVRTAAAGVSAGELAEDLRGLNRMWKRIQGKAAHSKAPSLIYHEQDMLRRVIRDTVSSDIERILVENAEAADKLRETIAEAAPELDCKISLRAGTDLFAVYGVEEQMQKALRRRVWLKSGGYIVFDQTEALTVVDVNTGKFVGNSNLEETVLTANLEAVTEIARQLRLRNTGGIIIIDFINMEQEHHRQMLVDALDEELKKDRTRVTMMGMTNLGLVELTRKKIGHELSYSLEEECPYCRGKGRVLRFDIAARRLLQEIEHIAQNSSTHTIQVMAAGGVAAALLGPEGYFLSQLEQRLGKRIRLVVEDNRRPEESTVRAVFED